VRLALITQPTTFGGSPVTHWIAGHPDYHPRDWSQASGVSWSPARAGGWLAGSGHARVGFEDTGNAAFSLSFSVVRTFLTSHQVASYLTSLHSRNPPHPWTGTARIRYDREDGGSVEVDAGECVLQLAAPAHSLGSTGQLSVVIPYILHGGVLGPQPVYIDPVAPVNPDVPVGYDDYDYDAILPSLPSPP